MKFVRLNFLFVFATLVVLTLGFASAAVIITGITSTTPSIQAGSQASFTVNVTATSAHSGTFTNAQLILPNLFVGASWTGDIGPFTLPPNTNVIKTLNIIAPSSQSSGDYSGVINFSGNYNLSSSPQITGLPITITVTPQPSSNLTITAPTTPIAINQNASLIVKNNGNSNLQVTMSETSTPSFGVTFDPTSFSLNTNEQKTVQAKPGLTNLKFGLNTVSIKADAGTQSATSTFQVKKTFCSAGEVIANLSISDISWENNGEGDDNSWELLDEIEIEVEVENRNTKDDVDVIVELGLFDSNGKNIADDLIFLPDSDSDDEKISINIDDDDEETVRWVFKVPADFKKGSYKLAVKAYDDDRGQSKDCRDSSTDFDNNFYQSIDIEEASDEGRYVVVDDISLDSQVSCGQTVTGQFTVFNIGRDDQDRVKILIRNKDLGVELTREITKDLDRGDDETLNFAFQVPATANNGNYILEFITFYDYKNGVYREESDDSFDATFEVLGCKSNLGGTGGSLTNINIDARLKSEAKPGKELVVVATIKNTGTTSAIYSLSARGYSSWADLKDISDGTINVDAGDSKEVTFTMLVNKDAKGKQSFDIQVAQDGRVQIQEVEVELSASKVLLFDTDNYLIWIIGAINLILIILIIVVAVRISRR